MDWYIHVADPGFPEPPWPGERRLGPYLTDTEAIEQAVSDSGYGMGVIVGVYSAEESEKRRGDETPAARAGAMSAAIAGNPITADGGKARYTRSQIEKRGKTLQRKLQAERARSMKADQDALEASLPAEIGGLEGLLKLVAEVGSS